MFKEGTINGIKVDRFTKPDACVEALQNWYGFCNRAALVTVDVQEASVRLEVLQLAGSPFERARLVREMRAADMSAQKSGGSSGYSMRPHEHHTILLPVPLTLLEMNLFASCTKWFPRIHVPENSEVSPPQNSARSHSIPTSVERLLSEKRAALSEKSAANFQTNVRAAIMELLVHCENSSCGTRAAFSSQSTSFSLTRRVQESMQQPQVFTVKSSGQLIPLPAPVTMQTFLELKSSSTRMSISSRPILGSLISIVPRRPLPGLYRCAFNK